MTGLPWADAIQIQRLLIADGWVSPDCYSNYYEQVTNEPAVYLFLLIETPWFNRAFVAYVGMSTKLKNRLTGHQVLSEFRAAPDVWPKRWFKPVAPNQLRSTEKFYIHHFDPPWNLIGRARGCL